MTCHLSFESFGHFKSFAKHWDTLDWTLEGKYGIFLILWEHKLVNIFPFFVGTFLMAMKDNCIKGRRIFHMG